MIKLLTAIVHLDVGYIVIGIAAVWMFVDWIVSDSVESNETRKVFDDAEYASWNPASVNYNGPPTP